MPGSQHRDWEFPCPPGNANDTVFPGKGRSAEALVVIPPL